MQGRLTQPRRELQRELKCSKDCAHCAIASLLDRCYPSATSIWRSYRELASRLGGDQPCVRKKEKKRGKVGGEGWLSIQCQGTNCGHQAVVGELSGKKTRMGRNRSIYWEGARQTEGLATNTRYDTRKMSFDPAIQRARLKTRRYVSHRKKLRRLSMALLI